MAEFRASSDMCCITTGYTDVPLQNRVGIYNIDEKDISGVDMIQNRRLRSILKLLRDQTHTSYELP